MGLNTTYGDMAAGALSFPMAPQLLTQDELTVIAGALQGWEMIARSLDPALEAWGRKYGGGIVDGHLKLKLQTWFRNWVEPPTHYVVHQPRLSNGLWLRLFRTTMRTADQIIQATRDIQALNEEEMVARYAHYLGVGARERYETFEGWWNSTLACISQGEWHLAVYSPRWEAFISPVMDACDTSDLVDRTLAEYPAVTVQLYPGGEAGGVWNLAEAIRAGALVEVMGSACDAPPFGNWGTGAQVPFSGTVAGRVIAGIIHHRPDRVQAVRVAEGALGSVEVDAPNLGALLQDLYSVTGWRPDGFSVAAMTGTDPAAMDQAVLALTQNFTRILSIPGEVFHEGVQSHPGITPVYSRLVSTLSHVDFFRRAKPALV